MQLACCMPRQVVDQWRNGERPFLPGHRALLCTVAVDLCLMVSVYIWPSAIFCVQADSCTSQQSKANLAQAHAAEAEEPMLQDEDLDLRPAFLR